ncbi:MAG TPA: group 1 truncated hemoglobin [Acidimicrobiales bacterium]|nr:group 1 truncated hemoglobin [Acidimicrobiales bacterium]
MEQIPLFERLGGRDAIQAVVEKTLANHFVNPVIKTRYEHAAMSRQQMIEHATEFFCTGLSGVNTYPGRPLVEAHAGMNVTDEEFCAVLDDIVDALDSQGIRDPERSEVLGILYSMKPEVVRL